MSYTGAIKGLLVVAHTTGRVADEKDAEDKGLKWAAPTQTRGCGV